MLEKLSVDFVRKLFYLLTNGNAQIKFHTICMQNQDREKAANRPIEFGLKLLGYNLFYRLPGLRDLPVGRRIGRDYLTRKYLRLPVEDLSSEILENPAAVCDVTDSLFLPVLGKRSFFQQVEKALDCPGFAKARLRLEDPCMGMEEIYQSLNRTLQKSLQPDTELKMVAANLMPNRYIIRLLDIAVYHGVTVHLTIDSSYPREFYLQLLKKNHIGFDTLAVSWEEKRRKLALVQELGLEKFGAVSADFNRFLRPLHKQGGRPIYYRAPVQLMRDTWHPQLSPEFRERYDAVCGAKVFSGKKRPSFAYELGYLCAGPLLYSLAFLVEEESPLCYAAPDSVLSRLVSTTCTTDSRISLKAPVVQVMDTGIDPEGFCQWLETLRRNHPETSFQTVSLEKLLGKRSAPLFSLFSGEENELSQGALDFFRDFSTCTGSSTIPFSDARSLYAWGYENMNRLCCACEKEISSQAAV